jgi:hypothetical protein
VYKLFSDLDAAIAQQYKIPNAKLSMQNTAPKLLMLKDCILTVPGKPLILLSFDPVDRLCWATLTRQANTTPKSSSTVKHSSTRSPTPSPSYPAK